MAGSPGAGKTEASIELIEKLGTPVIRIDPDELRNECPGYSGANAYLFQPAVSILVEKIHDQALEQSQSFVLDGTLSHYDRALRNIKRPIGRGRTVQILYVYQEPRLAWEFVQAREAAEGRRIPTEQFIEQYCAARDVVNRLKAELGKAVAARFLHIVITGFDAELAYPFEPGPASAKTLSPTRRVPGSPGFAQSAYDVAQALAWLTKERKDPGERVERMLQIPELMQRMLGG